MIGISSRSAGVLLLPKPGTGEHAVFDVVGGREQDPVEAEYRYSTAQDWEQIEGTDAEALLETATQEYWLARTVSFLRLAIGGELERRLEKRVLEHVEENLASRVASEKTLDRLLVAPLVDPRCPLAPAESALSYGFSAVASILDDLADLQPLLRRLTDLWLGLPATTFNQFSEPREIIWVTIVEKGELKQLLGASSRHEFTANWNLLAFHFSTPHARSGIQVLGEELCRQLFPGEGQEPTTPALQMEEAEPDPRDRSQRARGHYDVFERVIKQLASIAEAVSQGQDAKAERYLRELIQKQTSSPGGKNYAVKSLCNLAQRCADMFRVDFEEICLNAARELDPCDGWTLIQFGDHLKRLGKYDQALTMLDEARRFGENVVGQSSAADVYSQQGDYARAIRMYEAIQDFHDKPEVLTAIADTLRKMGRLEEAQAAYDELIESARLGLPGFAASAVRAQVGIAEIAKRQGRLEDALRMYREILKHEGADERDQLIHRLGLCNVLKRMEEFREAYSVVDAVVQKYPFAMQARFARGSILGLLGQEHEGLIDLPESSGSRSLHEWVRRYYRGLLLLKLERYGDARKNLVEEVPNAVASGEEKSILRMAAALWFLGKDDISEADGNLSEIPDLDDCHAQYLALVLKLHSAAQKKDVAMITFLSNRIAGLQVVDAKLDKAVAALGKRDFSLALTYEVDALLKLAA